MDERIVAALLDKGRLKEPDLARARRLQEETGGNLLSLLGRLGLVSERDHAETCAEVMDLPLVAGKDAPETPPELLSESQPLSLRFLKQFHMCPLGERDGRLLLWMADPPDRYAIDAVRLATGSDVERCVGLRSEIYALIERWHGQGRSAMGTILETPHAEASRQLAIGRAACRDRVWQDVSV